MSPAYSWRSPPTNRVAAHLDRLGRALEALAARVRDGLAGAVATVVGDAIAQALGAVLAEAAEDKARVQHPPPATLWDRSRRPGWQEDPLDPDYGLEDEYDLDEAPPSVATSRPTKHRRWPRALMAGLQASMWWLRRPGQRTVVAALGVGLTAGLAALLGGPVAAAVAGLAGTALGLAAVSNAVRFRR